jgi:hypothetical protein
MIGCISSWQAISGGAELADLHGTLVSIAGFLSGRRWLAFSQGQAAGFGGLT